MKKRKIRVSRGDVVFLTLNTLFLVIFFLITLYPLIYVVSASFSSAAAINSGRMWLWPVDIDFIGYKYVLKYK